ncbi:hypothetical protein J2S25_000991 [Mesobacillus stamsii]|uniref:Uncharacterized protein n=1 Tax=Mesobacillus stamsii TaxID=225347 RepID=A0ABU0FT82_9BACI|nr:hypothetical protein [Mesobacillus stamsii]
MQLTVDLFGLRQEEIIDEVELLVQLDAKQGNDSLFIK